MNKKPLKITSEYLQNAFTNSLSYQESVKNNLGTKKYHQCKICLKKFSKKDGLKSHSRVHTGEKPFECKICFKSFSQLSTLKRHIDAIHNDGSKPFKCELCTKPRYFNTKNNLKRHMKYHQEPKLKCYFCCKKFYERRSLKNHEQKCASDKDSILNEKPLVERRNKKLNVVRNFDAVIKKEKTVRIFLPPFFCLPNQQACLASQSVYSPENGVWLKPITIVTRNTPKMFVLPNNSKNHKNLIIKDNAKETKKMQNK